MIIVGDIACPTDCYSQKLTGLLKKNRGVFENNRFICNLEGLICADSSSLPLNTPVLYNHPTVLDALGSANLVGVGMANNHTLDLPEYFPDTKRLLVDRGVLYSGAGETMEEARRPFQYKDGDTDVMVFNCCWDFLLYHQNNPDKGVFISELEEERLLNEIKTAKTQNPTLQIVVTVHWSFDLETLPFPIYRQFSKLLIDAGATLVVGCHSHCVQGGEKYKEGYIVYGLGNFFIPHDVYAGGRLSFPEMSDLQLAFEYDFATKEAKCHWFKYNKEGDQLIEYLQSERFEQSEILKKYSPYASMGDAQYIKYFKNNRRKRFLVPIYKDINNKLQNRVFTSWLKARASFLRGLAKYNLRKWQN